MSAPYDVVIRNGLILDGTGREGFAGDVGITGGVIRAVGEVAGRGVEEIDAKGVLVTPGFIDVHTHYDGQVTWEERMEPSSSHGVTTVLTGNCGVGFAPCRPTDRQQLIHLMEGVEDIPEAVMAKGLPWNWETFPEYLNAVERNKHDINIAALLPHSCLRVYVMGQRGLDREPATVEDMAAMTKLVEIAMRAGALGLGTSRTMAHRDCNGTPIPTKDAEEAELNAIAAGMHAAGHGVLQLVSDTGEIEQDLEMLRRISRRWKLPASFTLAQIADHPHVWRNVLTQLKAAQREQLPIKAQVFPRATGILLGLDLSYNPFSLCPSYKKLSELPLAEKVKALRQPEVRARILSEEQEGSGLFLLRYLRAFGQMFALGDPPNYEPTPENSIAARAAKRGMRPEEFVYDMLLEDEGRAVLVSIIVNYTDGHLDPVLEMLKDENTVLALGDGGAHYGMICDAGYPTFMLSYWTRDRKGGKLKVPEAIKGMTSDPAALIGLRDRGRIAPGYRADVNIIDYDRLRVYAPRVKYDLPGGGRRLTQSATGYVATLVNGIVTRREDAPTGALPGQLVRGPKSL